MQIKPRGAYDSETMAMLARVLDDALKTLVGFRHAPLGDTEGQNLSNHLGRIILKAYDAGHTDPDTLKTIAVRGILKG